KPDTVLQIEDVLHVVCSKEDAKKLAIVVGEMSDVDVRKIKSLLTARPLLLTQKQVVGKSIEELNLSERYGISITRIHRAGLDLVAHPHIELQFGDRLTVVGEESAIQKVALELGDSLKQLHHPNLPALFLGIVLGVFLGSIPFKLPGVALPVKLGLAGGPLIVAIILARVGKIGPIIFYLPENTNLFLRELGITLFLAGVGLGAGGQFVETLLHGAGLYWIFLGAVITFVPLFVGALVARFIFKMNFMTLCGLLAGSMTDPPALSYANQLADSDAPSVTYASVYPLVMFLRIVTAQLLVIFLARV
ncbi:MAG: hypothetical protein HY582_00220, partial [Candidatus Omnitrophica bacterium]|nr:hypothetical protein [Candidatus Omnitrophota bacterium]